MNKEERKIDKKYIVDRISNWKLRLERLFDVIEQWCAEDFQTL